MSASLIDISALQYVLCAIKSRIFSTARLHVHRWCDNYWNSRTSVVHSHRCRTNATKLLKPTRESKRMWFHRQRNTSCINYPMMLVYSVLCNICGYCPVYRNHVCQVTSLIIRVTAGVSGIPPITLINFVSSYTFVDTHLHCRLYTYLQ
jgi:hypothetical protein